MDAGQLFRLDGKVALITGASSGLGQRFAEVAAAHGARVVLVARRAERLEALQARIEQSGGAAIAVPADLADPAALAGVFDAAGAAFGPVDVFVANAGISRWETPLQVTPESWRTLMAVDLDAVFFGCQEAARRMIAAEVPGSIITISSVAGLVVPRFLASYGIAKAAVIQMTKQLALEVGSKGIRVNGIAPGWILTEMSEAFLSSPDGQAFTAANPLGRHGQPEDLDGAFLLLASDAGRLITGITIPVEAGQLLR